MRSIRSYLMARLLGGATVVLLCAGVAVYLVVVDSLRSQFDRNLADRIQSLASVLFQVEDHVEFEFADPLMPEYGRPERPDYFELRFEDGRLLERSNSLGGKDLELRGSPGTEPTFWTARLPDGRMGRYAAQLVEVHHVHPEEGPDRPTAARIRIAITRDRAEVEQAERSVLLQCLAVGLTLVALIGILSWVAVDRGLEPARRLAATLDAIEVERLPARLEAGDLPAELVPMANKTDALIRRVDAALKRERRTTADVAHELRTPLSELLTVSEVALRDPRDAGGARDALRRVRDVAWRLGRTVVTILKLARLEMGAESFRRERVDIGLVVRELLRSLASLERERRLAIVNAVEPGTLIEEDPDVLRVIVSNLLSNALYYSPPEGRVSCRLDTGAAGWRLVVENTVAGLAPEDLRTLTEPFWRKDHARADRDRSGLGLALSRALAERTGMGLGFELAGDLFRATLARGAWAERAGGVETGVVPDERTVA